MHTFTITDGSSTWYSSLRQGLKREELNNQPPSPFLWLCPLPSPVPSLSHVCGVCVPYVCAGLESLCAQECLGTLDLPACSSEVQKLEKCTILIWCSSRTVRGQGGEKLASSSCCKERYSPPEKGLIEGLPWCQSLPATTTKQYTTIGNRIFFSLSNLNFF